MNFLFNLTEEEDPEHVFKHVCKYLDKYYQFSVHNVDAQVVKDVAGVVWMNFSLILDTLDGQYSRYTNQSSEFGGWYDGVSDCLKYILIFFGLCTGAYFNPYLETQYFAEQLALIYGDPAAVLLGGMWVVSNFFMIYYVHASRYCLSVNNSIFIIFSK